MGLVSEEGRVWSIGGGTKEGATLNQSQRETFSLGLEG